jgi:hypothetical protein
MLFIEGFGTRIAYRCGMNLWEDTLRTRILTAEFRIRARLGSALLEWKNTRMKFICDVAFGDSNAMKRFHYAV